MKKTLQLLIMDPPYESSNTASAFRVMEAALQKGHNVTVFAYEGATSLSFAEQKPHPNPVKGTNEQEEKHPLTKHFVTGLFNLAKEKGSEFKWINCGMCVDERGVSNWVPGPVRGGPAQFVEEVNRCDKTVVIATTR
ncbi:MAG: DsrE/DsrF/TusD sulfur relay family protein [Oligoflexales bacterium]